MMKHLFLAILSVFASNLYSQGVVKAHDITIDFDRAIHIVLDKSVEYVADGSKYIESTIVKESPNIVRIVALEENFVGKTNVTIISKGGEVYSYNIRYDTAGKDYTFYPDKDKDIEMYSVRMNEMNAAHIIFPEDVIYYKQGNELKFKVSNTSAHNVLKIEPSVNGLDYSDRSNLFVVDKNGIDYNIDIGIGENSSYTYNIGSKSDANVAVNEESIESLCKSALKKKRSITTQGFKKNKLEFSLNNIFVNGEQLFFVFELKNSSNIDLDIDFVKCFLKDQKTLKNEVQQDPEVDYKQSYNYKEKIDAKSNNLFVLVFDKFTIPDKKTFKIEIYERKGGRHINFNIDNEVIIKAKPI